MRASSASAASVSACRVFLVPGALGGDNAGSGFFVKTADYYRDYRDFFSKKGCRVATATLPMDASIEEHGRILRDEINQFASSMPTGTEITAETKDTPIWIVAHSQGALDIRYAIQSLQIEAPVTAVASIGAPHQGTPAASWTAAQRDQQTWIYSFLRTFFSYDLAALRFLSEMEPGFVESHAAAFAKRAGVRYGSARGVCTSGCHFTLWFSGKWFGVQDGDGLIPGESQRFGDDLGAYNLDHLSEIGVDSGKKAERERLLEAIWNWFRSGPADGRP